MRLKTFSAPTMTRALAAARDALGSDAIIVSSHEETGNGCRVTAAVEPKPVPPPTADTVIEPDPSPAADTMTEMVAQLLASHGVPAGLRARLARMAETVASDDLTLALAGALDAVLRFASLPQPPVPAPTLIMGPPGAGKTTVTAKLAAAAVLTGKTARVISADARRAGGVEQLEAFTRILNVPLEAAATRDALKKAVALAEGADVVLIDTAAVNPFDDSDRAWIEGLVAGAGAEAVLVMAAGADPLEAAEQALAFSELGAGRLVVTRLDLVRRLGSVLAAADAGGLPLAGVGISASAADPLGPLNPVSLARLLVAETADPDSDLYISEAV